MVGYAPMFGGATLFKPEMHSQLQAALRKRLDDQVGALRAEDCLDVIDYILARTRTWESNHLEYLAARLLEGGSVWRATPRGLERRVGETLQVLAESAIATGSRPAQYLAQGWHKAWGRIPDASGAYRDAVRAVEAAYQPIVSPKNELTTLGTVIQDIRNKPSKFSVRLRADEPEQSVGRLLATLELLWKAEFDRHGTPDEEVPLNVSLEEAQDAVALATTLVHLAQQGGFTASAR